MSNSEFGAIKLGCGSSCSTSGDRNWLWEEEMNIWLSWDVESPLWFSMILFGGEGCTSYWGDCLLHGKAVLAGIKRCLSSRYALAISWLWDGIETGTLAFSDVSERLGRDGDNKTCPWLTRDRSLPECPLWYEADRPNVLGVGPGKRALSMRKSSDFRGIKGGKMGVSSINRCLLAAPFVGGGVWREVLCFVRDGDRFGSGVCEVVLLAFKLGRSDMSLSLVCCRVLSTDEECNMDIIPLSRVLRRSCPSLALDLVPCPEVVEVWPLCRLFLELEGASSVCIPRFLVIRGKKEVMSVSESKFIYSCLARRTPYKRVTFFNSGLCITWPWVVGVDTSFQDVYKSFCLDFS